MLTLLLAAAPAASAAMNGFAGGDGDQVSLCADVSDWACLSPSEYVQSLDASGPADDGFVGGSKETQPDQWVYGAAAIQAKADLRAAWTSVTGGPGGRTFLNLSFARAGATGDTYVGIELNQKRTTWVNSAGSTIPCRSDGDVLLSYEASQRVQVSIHRWEGSGGPADCPDGRIGDWIAADSLGGAFEAAMNAAPVVNHLGVPVLGPELALETFGEATVDLGVLADALAGTEVAGCSYFRHMSVKTRSSAGIDSSLQDWAAGADVFARACGTPEEEGDVTAPGAPTVEAAAVACASPVSVWGTAEPGAAVTIYDGVGAAGFATAAGDGTWSTVLALADGAHSLSAEATDGANNTSVRSGAVPVSVDTVAPSAPALEAQSAGAGMVDLSGTAEPGAEVTISEGGLVVATVTAGTDGTFATTLFGVSAGDHSYVAVARDGCHASAPSPATVVTDPGPGDVVPPPAPSLTADAASCSLPLGVSGTAEPGATVTVYAGATAVGTAVADDAGAWTLAVTGLADGVHVLSAVAADAAGNRSPASPATEVDVDTTAPGAPTLQVAWTGAGMVELSGTAEAGAEIAILENGELVASTVAGDEGTFTTTLVGVAGTGHEYVAVASDRCRPSAQSAAAVLPAPPDTAAPAAPLLEAPASSCALPIELRGTAEPGATVAVYRNPDDRLGTVVADDSGGWRMTLTVLADGTHELSADATDAAGNVSPRSSTVSVAIDTAAPAAPQLEAVRVDASTVRLTGSAEAGRTVTIREAGEVVATAVAAADGSFEATVTVSPEPHSYTATVADSCGTSDASAPASVGPPPDTTPPGTPELDAAALSCSLPLTVSGTAEPGATVTVYAGEAALGSTPAAASGDWTLPVTALADGAHVLTAAAADAAGNVSGRSAGVTVRIDTVAPRAPELSASWSGAATVAIEGSADPGAEIGIYEGDERVATVLAGPDGRFATTLLGVSDGAHTYTASAADACGESDRSAPATVPAPPDTVPPAPPLIGTQATACSLPVVVSGTTEAGASVAVNAGELLLGSVVADATGAWELVVTALPDGTHSLVATATDGAGNRSAPSLPATVTLDATAPEAPTLSARWAGSGAVELTGEGEPGLEVTIREGGEPLATATVAEDGTFSVTLSDVETADHSYVATQRDRCHASPPSEPASVVDTTDRTPPEAPAVDVAVLSCAVPVLLSGRTEAGATVTVYDADDVIGSVIAAEDGAWELSLSSVAEGTHSFTAEARDAAGNLSARSAPAEAVVDLSAPSAPVLEAERVGGEIRLSGTAEPGRRVTIREGEEVVATATAGSDGSFEVRIAETEVAEHVYTATAADACRDSATSAPATVPEPPDVTAPEPPTLLALEPSCSLPVTLRGTAEPGAEVTVLEGESVAGTTVAATDGAWTLLLSALDDGEHTFVARAHDTAGNVSGTSLARTLRLDLTAPDAPELSAERSGDGVALSGRAEPGSEVTVREGEAVVAVLTAAPDGTFSTMLAEVSRGEHVFTAVAADRCRPSEASSSARIDALPDPDVTSPEPPTVSAAATACTLPVLVTGSTEPGASVTVLDGDAALGDAVADERGAWEFLATDLAEGPHVLAAQSRDAAGNVSARSAGTAITLDLTRPGAPRLEAARVDSETVVLTGSAEPGAALELSEGDVEVAALTVPAGGEFTVRVGASDAIAHTYTATAADACGPSPASAPVTVAAADDEEPTPPEDPDETDPVTPTDPVVTDPVGPTDPVAPAPVVEPAIASLRLGENAPTASQCMNKAFRAYLPMRMKGIRSARFHVDGALAAVVRKPGSLRQWYAVIDPARYAPGAHSLTARVTFRKRTRRRPVTVKLRFRRCDECRSRRSFRIRVAHLRKGERAVRAKVFVNGRPVKVVKGRRLRARVDLVGLPKGTFRVRIVARTNRGRIHEDVRTYRTCIGKLLPAKPKKRRPAARR